VSWTAAALTRNPFGHLAFIFSLATLVVPPGALGQEPIADVRGNSTAGVPLRLNEVVTVRGIVTVAGEFGGPSYLQDATGGLAVFGSSFTSAVARGDEVIVTGTVSQFYGLTELVNPVLDSLLSRGNSPEPLEVSAAEILGDGTLGIEIYEGLLVRLDGVTVQASGTWGAGTNYPLSDASGTTEVRIDNNTNLVGQPVPGGAFSLVGVVGQYKTSSPYIGGYQILPRGQGDVLSSGPGFATAPRERSITPTTLTIGWTTTLPGTSYLSYGTTPALELGTLGSASLSLDHAVELTGLMPATAYYVRAFSDDGADTSVAPVFVSGTASPPASTGAVGVYFSGTVDPSVAWNDTAHGNELLLTRLLIRVANARRSIDAAFYNLSSTPGTDVANGLIAAHQRGVSVRVICEADNRSNAPFNALAAAGIPVLTDAADPILRGSGLMHNKFAVVDGRGGAPESVWVWTGSWNPSFAGTYADEQNSIEIQDAALGNAYVMEFNEMWGSPGESPVPASCRFGSRKTDNTPHRFVIGQMPLECYFSPSDGTTGHIRSAIDSARHSVAFALLTMTRSDLRTSLVARRAAGLAVRGVLDNNTDTGTQYFDLLAGGVDVQLKPAGASYLLHHKYALIDAEDPAWNPVTVTGSHNWSNAAENSNDENTVIVTSGWIANLYLQEFTARYYEYGGQDTIRVGVEQDALLPGSIALQQNYPNPFNPETRIRYELPAASEVHLAVYSLLGQEVALLCWGMEDAGRHETLFDGRALASGVYLVRLRAGDVVLTRRMLLLR
jgi:hypothetical protein